ncbi:multidrug effflux MFS transporter [Saccharicrinis fermentans]|uniref:Sulfonamide resistance protein n=1 Tax=Saccharicrinis fermentans DSM 9555 = JCM 21142 TaxID=869213 RepID=W7Y7M5_9BACT|nr:multidrug effflux MFS transporter [Saccharicrinis fermentans]GAF03658.1 sulfonamide resistance protein [Saccharicrinis fermentans DSM 9555 = JCM 21142]
MLNIHKRKPLLLTVMLAALVTLSPFAIDSYLAAMPMMATFFGVHGSVIELTITLYFLGFALGNFLGGPLSDSFGRKPIAVLGVAIYGISALLIPLCDHIELILILRFTQAFGGGFATVTSNVFIRDWFTGKEVARFVTIISMMMMLAPLFAPVIGAFLIEHQGWQGVFYFMFAFSVLLWISFFILIPESREKALITKKVSVKQLFEKYKIFFSDKQSVIMLFAISFSMAGLYIFLTGASFIYIEFFGVETASFPFLFGANVVLNILLSLVNTMLLKKKKPGFLLGIGMLLQLMAGVTLFIVVRQSAPSFEWVFACIVVFVGSLGLIFGNGTAAILNINPHVSGSANATIGITRFVLSFIIGSIMALFRTDNLIPIGTAMFCCTFIGNILYVWARKYV